MHAKADLAVRSVSLSFVSGSGLGGYRFGGFTLGGGGRYLSSGFVSEVAHFGVGFVRPDLAAPRRRPDEIG